MTAYRAGMPADLVSTAVAARRLGLSERTIQRWVQDGLITPDLTTPGGKYRWDVERLREQINALARREDAD